MGGIAVLLPVSTLRVTRQSPAPLRTPPFSITLDVDRYPGNGGVYR